MSEFWQQLDFSTVVVFLLLAAGVFAGIRYLKTIRTPDTEEKIVTHDMLTNFRDLHAKGELSDEEYRTIKNTLAEQLQDEITEKDKTG